MRVKQGPNAPTHKSSPSYGYSVRLVERDSTTYLGVWYYPKRDATSGPSVVSRRIVADYLARGVWSFDYPDNVSLPEGL